MSEIRIRVPATSANLGPGLDAFGLALGLYLDLTVQRLESRSRPAAITAALEGEGAADLPTGEDNAVVRALRAALRAGGYEGPDLRLRSANEIPLARGLGSSAAAVVAGAAAGQVLCAGRVDAHWLLDYGLASEGHADNVAPCMQGGFTIVSGAGPGLACARFDPPGGLAVVVAVPEFELPTADSRRSLPAAVPRADAVNAAARASLVAAALATGRLDLLGPGMEDERLHEPYRSGRVPGLAEVRSAALGAGAFGAALSGAGPSVLAFVPEGAQEGVGAAMEAAWAEAGVGSRALSLAVDTEGLRAEERQE